MSEFPDIAQRVDEAGNGQSAEPEATRTTVTKPPRFCPRCSGTMLYQKDWQGAYGTCLSCGYVYEPGLASALKLVAEEKGKKKRSDSHRKLGF
ncbi:MAG TPA: hypothetical protein VF303_00245 [Candidatus Nanoarchaeia archaeon]